MEVSKYFKLVSSDFNEKGAVKGKNKWVTLQTQGVGKKERNKVKSLSLVLLFATPQTVAYQAPPSMGFSSKSTGVDCHQCVGGAFKD